jgi:hypothetical protein
MHLFLQDPAISKFKWEQMDEKHLKYTKKTIFKMKNYE